MKIKISELNGAALDWAVAKCEGVEVHMTRGGWYVFDSEVHPEFSNEYNDSKMHSFKPSTNWAQGGPIIERERIEVRDYGGDAWSAYDYIHPIQIGPTPLIAAMRCYVASKLGEEVEIPKELQENEE